MNITIIGTGYVGLVTGACFSEMGSHVTCVDVDAKKIENLKKGILPIYEPGLEDLVLRNYKEGLLNFSTCLDDAVKNSNIIFIAVETPPEEDGSADLQYILQVAKDIGQNINDFLKPDRILLYLSWMRVWGILFPQGCQSPDTIQQGSRIRTGTSGCSGKAKHGPEEGVGGKNQGPVFRGSFRQGLWCMGAVV